MSSESKKLTMNMSEEDLEEVFYRSLKGRHQVNDLLKSMIGNKLVTSNTDADTFGFSLQKSIGDEFIDLIESDSAFSNPESLRLMCESYNISDEYICSFFKSAPHERFDKEFNEHESKHNDVILPTKSFLQTIHRYNLSYN